MKPQKYNVDVNFKIFEVDESHDPSRSVIREFQLGIKDNSIEFWVRKDVTRQKIIRKRNKKKQKRHKDSNKI
ncbi:hypothetical protein BpHYR1_047821 [Brachionus plicatilis]|uniref:Uncharacterized protein n=1 Tax=Brachionus plicatilis TaxID=10195 RepID=A0A3M7RTR1_BRAPC|nr:hypothetical protein BpHYR1_047821 [Brachionus plicatilis]